MVKPGEEIYITEVEAALLRVFAGYGQFNDSEIVNDLLQLANKLKYKSS
jgi:hypothetical protein